MPSCGSKLQQQRLRGTHVSDATASNCVLVVCFGVLLVCFGVLILFVAQPGPQLNCQV